MGTNERPVKGFGPAMAEEQDRWLSSVDPTQGRERLVLAALSPRVPRRRPLAVAALFAAAAAVFAFFFFGHRPLSFEVGGHAAALGAWITEPVAFSEGTRLNLGEDAQCRVVAVDELGARVVLERGLLQASVVHRDGARWSVSAGPFEVRVTGTRFDVRWDPAMEVFSLTLLEGGVVVTGPLVEPGRAVSAGETLRIAPREHRLEVLRSDAPSAPTATPSASSAGSAASVPEALPSASSSSDAPRRVTWQELAQRGKYGDALALIDAEGIEVIEERASAKDLLALSDTARFAKRAALSRAALLLLRQKYAGSKEAATAAFLLGRAAADGQGADAERWFELYLAEQPSGPLAREALGRVLDARVRRGDKAGARVTAKAYLDAYPNGPHASVAHSALGD